MVEEAANYTKFRESLFCPEVLHILSALFKYIIVLKYLTVWCLWHEAFYGQWDWIAGCDFEVSASKHCH